jgi:hypothetical protein
LAELAELQNIDTSVLDTIKADQGSKLLERAQQEYPYLAGKDIAYKYSPQKDPEYKLEFYQGGDLPDWAKGRKTAIEVFNPKTTPLDVLGDYVSHYGVQQDPQLQAYYQQFQNLLDPAAMQQRYQYHTQNLREERPYEQWAKMTGVPEMFRGYTFNQWENAKDMYTPQQLQVLDQVRKYLGVK